MARKIKIEEYLKDKNKKSWKSDRIKLFSLILNGVLLVSVIVLIVILLTKTVSKKEYDTTLSIKNSRIRSLELQEASTNAMLDGQSIIDLKEKASFLDKNIVFKIKGYGNYYYTYDCVKKKANGKAYSYWAYNIDAAKSEGLKKGGC